MEQVPTARVMGALPPLGPSSSEAPRGFVMPLYSLYSVGQVALATFLGSPVAGCWLVARNFKKLGAPGRGWAILALGLVWTAGLCGLAMLEKLPGVVSVLSIPGMVLVMRGVQGEALDHHTSLGGKTTSWGYAVGAALAWLAILTAIVIGVAVAWALATRAPTVEAPSGSEVAYRDGATEADAINVRAVLTTLGYFTGPVTVQVQRDGDRYVVGYVVTDEALGDSSVLQALGDLSDSLSIDAFDNAPVDTLLLDDEGEPRRRVAFESRRRTRVFGKDTVVFRDIPEAQARAVHDVLAKRDYFDGSGVIEVRREARLIVELEAEAYSPQPLDDLINQDTCHALSHALGDAPVDLVFGNLAGKVLVAYRWPDLGPEAVHAADDTDVFFREGATRREAELVARVIPEHDDGLVLHALVLRDDNFQPPRPVVAVFTGAPDEVETLHALAEPLSKIAFGGAPVDVRIIDRQLALKVALPWEKRPRGAVRPRR